LAKLARGFNGSFELDGRYTRGLETRNGWTGGASAMSQDFLWSRDRTLVERLADELGVADIASADALRALGAYLELVATWNRKLDLTAARSAGALVEVMLADAFMLASADTIAPSSRVLDVGSGAGAPVLPLLLLRSDLSAVLVEPLRKRVAFLRTALGTLGLVKRASVLEQKLELAAERIDGAAAFDVALSRATFAPELWLPLGLRLAPRTLVLLAGQAPPRAAGAELEQLREYKLPSSQAERKLARYQRV
jgi:16S rRNA (guanine527-N7)-methyltransferase